MRIKYVEAIAMALIIVVQWFILSGIFIYFWDIVRIKLFIDRFLDQFIKLVIGGLMLLGWLIEWYLLSIFLYRKIRRCK